MNLQIYTQDFELSTKMKAMIEAKLNLKLDQWLTTFNEEMKTATLHLSRDKKYHLYNAHFDMMLPGNESIVAKNSHARLVTTIVGLREIIERQIKKYKAELKNN